MEETYHLLGGDLPVSLNVPETQSASVAVRSVRSRPTRYTPYGRRDGLDQSKVSILKERELEPVVLANVHESARRVEALDG